MVHRNQERPVSEDRPAVLFQLPPISKELEDSLLPTERNQLCINPSGLMGSLPSEGFICDLVF